MQTISIRKSLCVAVVAGAASLYATSASTMLVGDHYEDTQRISVCTIGASTCQRPMTTVPAGKNLLVTSVACSLTYNGPPTFQVFLLSHKGAGNADQGDAPFTYLIPTALPFT